MGLIEIRDVCKSFGEKVALDHVSIDVPQGKIYGLLGPNGAGKTTAIRIVNRITIPTSGEVFFDGRRITDADVARIGYLPEERGLYRKMEVGDQALYLAQLKGMTEELSKGMAQKVQFITTVVHKPSLMILDEPFSGFDPVNAELIRTEILRLRDEGATIILSTHNMESVEELCDEITLINRSRVVISGGVDEIRHRYGNNHIELIYTGSTPVRAEEGVFTVLSDEDNAGRHTAVLAVDPAAVGAAGSAAGATGTVLRSLLEQGLAVNSFRELIPRMNDIFIKLVTEGA